MRKPLAVWRSKRRVRIVSNAVLEGEWPSCVGTVRDEMNITNIAVLAALLLIGTLVLGLLYRLSARALVAGSSR